MMLPPFLTDDEIATLTAPLTQGAARCKFLRDQFRVTVKKRPNGQPVVGRAEFEAAMLARSRSATPRVECDSNVLRLDWTKIRAARQK